MTIKQASAQIAAFRASGRAGWITFHFASPGKPGQKNVLCTVEIHERLPLDRGADEGAILDMGSQPA